MKNINAIVGGITLCSALSFGQTNVIALKSHAGTANELLEKEDNFGLPDPAYEYRYVDSVKYVKKEKIVINYRTYGVDTSFYTHEEDSMIQEHLKAIRLNPWYPEKTTFIGFPKEIEKLAAERGVKQNSFSFLFILSILGAGGLVVRKTF